MNYLLRRILWILGITAFVGILIISLYFEIKCGTGNGTLADIPRYCWFFK